MSDIEWNGEGLPPVGVECNFTPDNTVWGFNYIESFTGCVLHYEGEQFVFMLKHEKYKLEGDMVIVSRTDKGEFSKPETPEQKAERERMEAAERLHDIAQDAYFANEGGSDGSATWDRAPDRVKNMYLAIVDETNYRKQ